VTCLVSFILLSRFSYTSVILFGFFWHDFVPDLWSIQLPRFWSAYVSSQSQSHIAADGRLVSKSWCRAPSGAHGQIFITILTVTVLFFVGLPLWREDGSVFCICCWSLPAQSFSGPNPLVLATIFYCLRSETSLFVASYDSQGHGGNIRSRLHTGFFSSLYLSPLKQSVCAWNRGHLPTRLHFQLLRFPNNLVA
jgi:hypothetical protein